MTQDEFNPPQGVVQTIGHELKRILAPNPSPMTFKGTNTYILGKSNLAVIDPGPDSDSHLASIEASLNRGQRFTHVFVTHSHLDHSPLALRLAARHGASIYAYGPSDSGRSQVMRTLAAAGLKDSGEGVDHGFSPDISISDGQVVETSEWKITAYWTPGHLGNHMCFRAGETVFSGDLAMGWASSLISPPDGDLTDFMASCEKLRKLNAKTLHAGHGAPVTDPNARLEWLLSHRKGRETEVLSALKKGTTTVGNITAEIYVDTPPELMGAASRNVLAHLVDLMKRNIVSPVGEFHHDGLFSLNTKADF